ncbi:MAG TPA: LuxR C-terminal-related transcriptional regulator [Bacteroidales bacterium]|nr:LuxR C-terminal-related transcriptional regulator [Bacteroidales bacterium]
MLVEKKVKKEAFTFLPEDILNSANTLIHIDDLEARKMVYGNDKFEEILGFTAAEVIEMEHEYIQKYYHPDDLVKIPEIIDFFKGNKNNKHTTLFRVKHKNGEWVYFITTRSLLNIDSNQNRFVVSVSINVTEQIDCGLKHEEYNKIRKAERNRDVIEKFTNREKEIISLFASGHTNTQVAEKLFLSIKTVDNHRTNILRKSEARNIAELINFVKDIGLV